MTRRSLTKADDMSTTTFDIQQIADNIHADIAGMKQAEADWSSYVLSLCQHVAEARAIYKADRAFGAWWDAQGFGMNHQDRAALVAMGQDIDRAKEVLAVTDRRSIQLIARDDFPRFTSASKPTAKAPKADKKRVARSDLALLLKEEAAGRPLPPPSETAVRERMLETNEKYPKIRAGQVAILLEEEMRRREEACAPDEDAALEERIQRLAEVRAKVLAEEMLAGERAEMWAFITKDVQEKVRYAERFLFHKNTAAPLTVPEFKTLLFALHPDQTTEEHRTNALSIIKAKKEILTVDEVFFKPAPALPTFEDYMAAKKQATADRKAKKAKKEAA